MDITCPCGKKLRAPEQAVGKKVRCPACLGVLAVPAPLAIILEDTPPSPAPRSSARPTGAAAPRKRAVPLPPRTSVPWLPVALGGAGLLACVVAVVAVILLLNQPPATVQPAPGGDKIAAADKTSARDVKQDAAKKQPPPEQKPPAKQTPPPEKTGKDEKNKPAPVDAKAQPGSFFYLEPRPAPKVDQPDAVTYNTLLHEITRQSLLIAARDYLNLTTRDAGLGEHPPEGLPAGNWVAVSTFIQHQNRYRASASLGSPDKATPFYLDENQLKGDLVIFEWAVWCESQSRVRMPDALRKAGFAGKPNLLQYDVKVPKATETLLDQMTFTAQYQAVRELHALMRARGESPVLLAALARGYANLGLLTESNWDSSSKIFQARALLYAQRLTVREAHSPLGFWTRAYACGLMGLHRQALDDVGRAVKQEALCKEKGGAHLVNAERPAWSDLIEAYCRFDTAKLAALAKQGRVPQLAQLLRYLTVEDETCFHRTLEAARELLADNPECYRVHDAIAGMGGVSSKHVTTVQGLRTLGETFPKRLAVLPGLPDSVRPLLADEAQEPAVYRALAAAGKSDMDHGELSWAVLGRLALETRFSLACRRLDFMHRSWVVPTADFVRAVEPLLADHPCLPFVQTYALSRARDRAACRELLAALPAAGYESAWLRMTWVLKEVDVNLNTAARMRYLACSDRTQRDYGLLLTTTLPAGAMADVSRWTLSLSPHAPLAKAKQILADWPAAEKHAEAWEQDGQHAHVLYALGQQYHQLRRFEDAERCLRKAIELSPDHAAYKFLAESYKAQGKTDLWRQTLAAYLKEEDTGLAHAQVQVEVARDFMKRKEFQKALPHAEAAAKTYAAWAMLCAGDCHEGLGNWDQAELWFRRVSERYPDNQYQWYLWCVRTGKGDIKAAEKQVAQSLAAMAGQPTDKDRGFLLCFYNLNGEKQKAVAILKPWFQQTSADSLGLLLIQALDDAGDLQGRDQTMQQVFNKQSGFGQLAGLCRDCLTQGEKAKPNLAAVEAILKQLPAGQKAHGEYFIGCFLDRRGHKQDALEYLGRCAAAAVLNRNEVQIMATARLRTLGGDPNKLPAKE